MSGTRRRHTRRCLCHYKGCRLYCRSGKRPRNRQVLRYSSRTRSTGRSENHHTDRCRTRGLLRRCTDQRSRCIPTKRYFELKMVERQQMSLKVNYRVARTFTVTVAEHREVNNERLVDTNRVYLEALLPIPGIRWTSSQLRIENAYEYFTKRTNFLF